MAYCGSRCPYHWHDNECEYCSARGDAVIDLENYSYDNCPYYLEYKEYKEYENYVRERKKAEKAPSGAKEHGSFSDMILGIIVIAAIIMLCTHFFDSSASPVSSRNVPQTAAPAEETPEDEQLYQDSGFVFPNSDSELIESWKIESLSDSDLTYAINEIYARHGYIFRSSELRGYYEQFSWYSGQVPADQFSVDCFNQTEQQNWNLLVRERDRRRASN